MSTLLPRLAASILLLGGASGLAHAQAAAAPGATAPDAPSTAQPDDEDDEGASDPCASQPGAGSADGDSSSQLSDCGGVLTPPDNGTSSGREVMPPDPDPGTTPVLPPGVVPDQAPNGNDSGSGTSGG